MNEIRFIDLFSGIGGFRLGLEKANREIRVDSQLGIGDEEGRSEPQPQGGGGRLVKEFRCVWSCDWNRYANQVYLRHWPQSNHHSGDVRGVDPGEIPDFDLLCTGFPCQSFSVAGQRKGFQDPRGTLFWEILRIAEHKKPALLLLENVKGLLSNDRGQTFLTILEELGRIGYWTEWQTLNSKWFGIPQNRERVFIIGHLGDGGGREVFPITEIDQDLNRTRKEAQGEGARVRGEGDSVAGSLGVGGSFKERNLVTTVQTAHLHNKRWGNWFKTQRASPTLDGAGSVGIVVNTLFRRYHKDGSENLILQRNQRNEVVVKRESGAVHQSMSNNQAPLAIELAYTKANMRAGRFSEVCHALDGGASKGVVVKLVGDRDDRSLSLRENMAFTVGANEQSKAQKVIVVGNTVPSQHTSGRVVDPKGVSPTFLAKHNKIQQILSRARIRRLTPCECERLQGFPDGWTEGVSDTQRYKLLGNAVTVNVVEFLGRRILERCFV